MHAPIQKLAFFQKFSRSHVSRSLFDISWIKEQMFMFRDGCYWVFCCQVQHAWRTSSLRLEWKACSIVQLLNTHLVRENVWKQPIQVLFWYAHPQQTIWQFSMNFWMRLYVLGNNRFPDGPQFDIWNCFPEIARFCRSPNVPLRD